MRPAPFANALVVTLARGLVQPPLALSCAFSPDRRASNPRAAPAVPCRCVQLLNEWSAFTTEAGFIALRGTVYNCPGAYDGQTTHRTSTVVDCAARVLRTMEGAEYYLGFQDGHSSQGLEAGVLSNEESKALGLLEDGMLAV